MSLFHVVVMILMAVLALLMLVTKKAIELVLEKEYGVWAPALARLLVRLGGFVCVSRREQWWADLLYVQQVEHDAGLLQASSCLISAPWLAFRHARTAKRGDDRPPSVGTRVVMVEESARAEDQAAVKVLTGRDEVPIEDLDLSIRTFRPLKAKGITTVGELLNKEEGELLHLRNFSRTHLNEVKERLVEKGFVEPDK